jgi:hypothetical protein
MGYMRCGKVLERKPLVEDCLSIDTTDLRRLGLLTPGTTGRPVSLIWTKRGEKTPHRSVAAWITVNGVGSGALRLRYSSGQPSRKQRLLDLVAVDSVPPGWVSIVVRLSTGC